MVARLAWVYNVCSWLGEAGQGLARQGTAGLGKAPRGMVGDQLNRLVAFSFVLIRKSTSHTIDLLRSTNQSTSTCHRWKNF